MREPVAQRRPGSLESSQSTSVRITVHPLSNLSRPSLHISLKTWPPHLLLPHGADSALRAHLESSLSDSLARGSHRPSPRHCSSAQILPASFSFFTQASDLLLLPRKMTDNHTGCKYLVSLLVPTAAFFARLLEKQHPFSYLIQCIFNQHGTCHRAGAQEMEISVILGVQACEMARST